ncbi:MAG: DNA polymerase III subunit gamma/tau, partial [Saccharothrix sp.]|nr:DNA polymerase III subunit gamma/tau [Saccharothrix sp.]
EVDGNTVTITHGSAPLARRLAEPRTVDAIATAFGQVFGGSWQVRCVHGAPNQATPRPTPQREQRAAPTRPSQAARQQESRQPPSRSAPADDIPPPPEPPEPDEPLPPEPVDEEEMLAEAARPGDAGDQLDPEQVVLKLLADELGARPLKS